MSHMSTLTFLLCFWAGSCKFWKSFESFAFAFLGLFRGDSFSPKASRAPAAPGCFSFFAKMIADHSNPSQSQRREVGTGSTCIQQSGKLLLECNHHSCFSPKCPGIVFDLSPSLGFQTLGPKCQFGLLHVPCLPFGSLVSEPVTGVSSSQARQRNTIARGQSQGTVHRSAIQAPAHLG